MDRIKESSIECRPSRYIPDYCYTYSHAYSQQCTTYSRASALSRFREYILRLTPDYTLSLLSKIIAATCYLEQAFAGAAVREVPSPRTRA